MVRRWQLAGLLLMLAPAAAGGRSRPKRSGGGLEVRHPAVERVELSGAVAAIAAAVGARRPLVIVGCGDEAMRGAWAPAALAVGRTVPVCCCARPLPLQMHAQVSIGHAREGSGK